MRDRPTVLITSASAKVLLVRSFREAGARVIATDSDPFSAALYEADAGFVAPKLSDDGVEGILAELCRREGVDLLVPTRDGELIFFAERAQLFEAIGTRVVVSNPDAVATCLDKQRFIEECNRIGVPIPHTWSHPNAPDRWPVFVRPRFAAGGQGARPVEDANELQELQSRQRGDLIVQEYVDAPEYSIDVLCDFDGSPLQAVVRRRLRIRAGEAIVSEVEHRPDLEHTVMHLCAHLRLVGHIVAQAFDDDRSGPQLIEINPRFGGASNLSIAAGLDSPARLLALHAGDAAARLPRPIRNGLRLLRYSVDHFVSPETQSLPSLTG